MQKEVFDSQKFVLSLFTLGIVSLINHLCYFIIQILQCLQMLLNCSRKTNSSLHLTTSKVPIRHHSNRTHSSGLCNQVSISPTFYTQLLSALVPKAQKDNDDLTVFILLLGYLRSLKQLVKLLQN